MRFGVVQRMDNHAEEIPSPARLRRAFGLHRIDCLSATANSMPMNIRASSAFDAAGGNPSHC
jgi:hypothetical protein